MNVLEYEDVKQLNSFLRGEMSAVLTYEQCIEPVTDAKVIFQLRMLQASHQRRADLLQARIAELGGEPASHAGVWGGLTQVIEGGAALFGPKAALMVLEKGEEHGLADYLRDTPKLSTYQRAFVEAQLLPEQERTQEIIEGLGRAYEGPHNSH